MPGTRKLLIGGALILTGGLLMRYAWAIYTDVLATVFIITGAIIFIGGIIFFAMNFRE